MHATVPLLERAALDTSASLSRWDDDRASTGKTAIVCEEFAISTKTRIAAIEYRGLVDVIGVGEPIPVLRKSDKNKGSMSRLETHGLVALVAAFIPKGLLVCPHKVAMPGEEEAVTMYSHSLINMDGNKVIEARLRCRGPGLVRLGWQCSKALYRFDVGFAVRLAHVLPRKNQQAQGYAQGKLTSPCG